MARAKYKIGTLVKIKTSDEKLTFGEITGVITTKNGITYQCDEDGESYSEDQFVCAYREVRTVNRKKRPKVVEEKRA
jgi:hypothetical protein